MEFYSAVKNDDIIVFIGKGMKLEKNIPNELSQTLKDKYGFYSFIWGYYPLSQ